MIKSLALTASAGRYDRFPDLDTVMPLVGNPELKSPQADHFTLGLKGDVAEHWNWSLEGYQKNSPNYLWRWTKANRMRRFITATILKVMQKVWNLC